MNPILEFRAVHMAVAPGYDGALQDLSFVLQPGELALFEVEPGHSLGTVTDLATGLLDPESGSVLFQGKTWPEQTADQAAAARGRIGRVFDTPGWVSNLDVDENITLPARYHQLLEEGEAYRQAQDLATRLGLSGLPPGRPAHIARPELRRAEWVRALLGPHTLVIMERPLRDLPSGWSEPLLSEVERQRGTGVAFLWVQTRGAEAAVERLKPTLHFKVESGNIIRI